MDIRKKIEHVNKIHYDNLLLCGCIQAISLTLILSPLLVGFTGQKMSDGLKARYFMLGFMSSLAQSAVAQFSGKNSALKRVYDDYIKKGTAREIVNTAKLDEVIDTIGGQESLVQIVETMPDFKKPRYIAQFKLQGLLKPPQQPQNTEQGHNNHNGEVTVKKALPVINREIEQILDISWMNHAFFFRSAVILGAEGDGKTSLLAYMAINIFDICPDVDLKIHNIHYDPDDEDDRWFPGMPKDVEASLFITDPAECIADMRAVYAEMQRRVNEEGKFKGVPVIRIVDEFQGLKDLVSEDEWEDYLNCMKQLKNQGRKYAKKVNGQDTGFRVIAGMHSLKKGETGLDSGFFAGANIVCMGNTITDQNTPFPSDFNTKQLVKEIGMANAQLVSMGLYNPATPHTDRARAAVTRLGKESPCIRIFPRFDLSNLSYRVVETTNTVTEDSQYQESNQKKESTADQYAGDDYMAKLKTWYTAKKGDVTDDDLKQQMFILSGKVIPDDLLQQLRRILDES